MNDDGNGLARRKVAVLGHVGLLAALLAPCIAVAAAGYAFAGLGDSPLPQFSDGKQGQLILRVSGVVKRDRLETVVLCTSLDDAPVDIGVEMFDTDATLLNDIGAGVGAVLDVSPGQTVTFATSTTATYLESEVIPVIDISQGAARVVATSSRVRCNVMLVDDFVTPPVSLATLGAGVEPTAGALPPGLPLPQFSDAQSATHAALFPGAISRGDVETAIFCTSLAASPIDVGVELLGSDGVVANSVAAGNGAVLNVAPGATVTFATTGTASFLETAIVTAPPIAQGLARVVSTSAELTCEAVVLDAALAPPTSMSGLARGAEAAGTTLRAPLPTFSDGKPSLHVATVPGVLKRDTLQTLFVCSSVDASAVDIGVQIFALNGTLLNDVSAGVGAILDVAPGRTVTIATSTTASYLETTVIPVQTGLQGVGRVVASSDKVRCNAMVVDDLVTPPVTLMQLGTAVQPGAGAQLSSVALPVFGNGHQATHAAYFPGVIKRGNAETDIFCTSVATGNVDIGVQVFRPDGTIANDVAAGNGAILDVAPGATVTFGTTGTAALLETQVITLPGIAQGLARVVSNSDQVLCSGVVLDAGVKPPGAMSALIGYGADTQGQCGNGTVDAPEQCDDGDATWIDGDYCDATCTLVACGDPNDTGTLTATDALFTLRTAVGLQACDPCICNVDGNTTGNPITASDALRVLRKSVGLVVDFTCPSCL